MLGPLGLLFCCWQPKELARNEQEFVVQKPPCQKYYRVDVI